jgi:hypothetical protein
VSHDTYFKIKSDSKLLWAGGSRQVKLIDGVAVPLLEGGGGIPPVSMGFGGLPPFDGQEQNREWTRVSTFKA